jgi:hypothetical protein
MTPHEALATLKARVRVDRASSTHGSAAAISQSYHATQAEVGQEVLDYIATLEREHGELRQALRDLARDSQHAEHNCGDDENYCPVLGAKATLMRIPDRSVEVKS